MVYESKEGSCYISHFLINNSWTIDGPLHDVRPCPSIRFDNRLGTCGPDRTIPPTIIRVECPFLNSLTGGGHRPSTDEVSSESFSFGPWVVTSTKVFYSLCLRKTIDFLPTCTILSPLLSGLRWTRVPLPCLPLYEKEEDLEKGRFTSTFPPLTLTSPPRPSVSS